LLGIWHWFIGTDHAGGEILYWCSQILLAVIAIVGAVFAFNQIKTFKLLELLKYLEQPHVRDARRVVRRDIGMRKLAGRWWDNDDRLEQAASIVCASFNTTAAALRLNRFGSLESFFARHWGGSIIVNYEILLPMIEDRRGEHAHGPEYMSDFRWLYKKARRYHPQQRLPSPPADISPTVESGAKNPVATEIA
jgi:hypothetical protein